MQSIRRPFCCAQWVYQVTIENQGNKKFQLISRDWHVQDHKGEIEPAAEANEADLLTVLSPRKRSFQYINQVSLASPFALMG
jgi:uncharacterized protein affecting Mg2+/Co2+ transport